MKALVMYVTNMQYDLRHSASWESIYKQNTLTSVVNYPRSIKIYAYIIFIHSYRQSSQGFLKHYEQQICQTTSSMKYQQYLLNLQF